MDVDRGGEKQGPNNPPLQAVDVSLQLAAGKGATCTSDAAGRHEVMGCRRWQAVTHVTPEVGLMKVGALERFAAHKLS